MGIHKYEWDLLDHGSLKSGVSHKWFDGLSRLVEWFLHVDSDLIIFGFTTNLLCLLDICWVFNVVVLVKYLLWCFVASAHRRSFRTWFSQTFSIKAWLGVERLFSYFLLEKIWEMTRNLNVHPAQLLNPTISKFCHFSYMVITLCNLNILLSLLLLSHPTISNLTNPPIGFFSFSNPA